MAEEEPKLAHWWAFPVAPDTHRLDPGARALFEAVRDDPTIRKVVLTRSRRFDLDGENVVALPIDTREGQEQLARCREILVDRPPRAALDLPLAKGSAPVRARRRRPPDRADGRWSRCDRGSKRVPRRSPPTTGASTRWWRPAGPTPWPRPPPRLSTCTSCGSPACHGTTWSPAAWTRLPDDLRRRGAGAARPARWPPAAACCGRDRARPSAPVRRRRAGLAGGVVPAATTPSSACARAAVDRAGSHTQTLTPFGAWGLSARTCPIPRWCCRVADAVVTDDADEAVDFLLTGRPLLALTCRTGRPGRRAARPLPPRDRPCPDPVLYVVRGADRRPRRRSSTPPTPSGRSRTSARSTSRSRTPTTCRAGAWSNASGASTSTAEASQRFGGQPSPIGR